MIPANEILNFIMVIIIENGFQVDVEIGKYLRKMVSHTAPDGPYRPQKRILILQSKALTFQGGSR